MPENRIVARYWIETAFPLEQAAEVLAGEQSSGPFVKVPGETEELRERHAAQVESITAADSVSLPSLPGGGVPRGLKGSPVYRRAEIVVSWPLQNLGPSLPNLMATNAGWRETQPGRTTQRESDGLGDAGPPYCR